MSRYIVAVPVDPRFDKYKYVAGGVVAPVFTNCVFDAVWYDNRINAESVKDDLSREYHAIVLSLENTIYQLDRENGYVPFYIIRDLSDNRMIRRVMMPIHMATFTDDLKNAKKYESAADAMDDIADMNYDTVHPYDFIIEMHHFDEFYKQLEESHFTFISGGRGCGKSTSFLRNQMNNVGNNSILSTKEMYAMFGTAYHLPEIKKVIFSKEVTIVLWKDGTKTIVRCQDGETFDPEKGLAIAFMKKAFGNKGNYYDKVRDLLDNATYQDEENHSDRVDRKDDAPYAKKTKRGTYMCPHCSRFIPSKHIEGKKGPFICDKCGKKFNINWEGELDYEF